MISTSCTRDRFVTGADCPTAEAGGAVFGPVGARLGPRLSASPAPICGARQLARNRSTSATVNGGISCIG
jgi:hypothetical protein